MKLHKNIYVLGKKLPKRDRFGLHSRIENICLECLKLAIEAALTSRDEKRPLIRRLQTEVEVVKQYIRVEQELAIITPKTYFSLVEQSREISKMAAGWMRYLEKGEHV